MPITGERNDNFSLSGIDITKALSGVMDKAGLKKANVYFLTRQKGREDIVTQMLPTPYIRDLDLQSFLDSGGSIEVGNILLQNIPSAKYSEAELLTSSKNPEIKRYFIISGPAIEPKAYTTERVSRPNPLLFDVYLRRYKPLNSGELKTILELEDDMGLTQEQVDARVRALVSREEKFFEANLSLDDTNIAQGTEEKIGISSRPEITETGITIADNELTFVNSGLYHIFGSLLVKLKPDASDNPPQQNSRCVVKAIAKVKRSGQTSYEDIPEGYVTQYIRASIGSDVAGTGAADWGQTSLHDSFAYKFEAGDKLAFYINPLIKQVANNTLGLDTGSSVEVVWYSI